MNEHTDPAPNQRTYYRRGQGSAIQRAYAVERNGIKMLKLEDEAGTIVRLDAAVWYVERELRPLTRMMAAKVAFEQDRAVCAVLQLHLESRKLWIDLSPDERIAFMEQGPGGHPMRRRLFESTMEVLAEICA